MSAEELGSRASLVYDGPLPHLAEPSREKGTPPPFKDFIVDRGPPPRESRPAPINGTVWHRLRNIMAWTGDGERACALPHPLPAAKMASQLTDRRITWANPSPDSGDGRASGPLHATLGLQIEWTAVGRKACSPPLPLQTKAFSHATSALAPYGSCGRESRSPGELRMVACRVPLLSTWSWESGGLATAIRPHRSVPPLALSGS
jgi:hypothetical protein